MSHRSKYMYLSIRQPSSAMMLKVRFVVSNWLYKVVMFGLSCSVEVIMSVSTFLVSLYLHLIGQHVHKVDDEN